MQMPAPQFIGIGAQRAGSSWLSELLASHPDICIPKKEIHYFDRNYDKGLDWYRSRFQGCSGDGVVCGEFTPKYMFDETAATRLIEDLPDIKLICVLRDPVKRLYSHYKWARHKGAYGKGFLQFARENREAVRRGFYYQQLLRFDSFYSSGRLLVVVSEEVQNDFSFTCQELGAYLGIDPTGFVRPSAINVSMETRLPTARRAFSRLGSLLHKNNVDWALRVGVKYVMPVIRSILEKNVAKEQMHEEEFEVLANLYRNDVLEVEKYLGRSLKAWPTRTMYG